MSDRHRSFTGLQVPGSTFLDRCRDAIIAAAVAVRGVPSTLKDSFNYVHEFPKEIWVGNAVLHQSMHN